jgi:hypothetical protein
VERGKCIHERNGKKIKMWVYDTNSPTWGRICWVEMGRRGRTACRTSRIAFSITREKEKGGRIVMLVPNTTATSKTPEQHPLANYQHGEHDLVCSSVGRNKKEGKKERKKPSCSSLLLGSFFLVISSPEQ